MIDVNKYYKLSEIPKLHPLLEKRGVRWLYDVVARGQLKATNTSHSSNPRYLVKGSDIQAFIASLA